MVAPGVAILGANTPWVYALAAALADRGHPVRAIAAFDAGNFRRLQPRWPEGTAPAGLRREVWVYPPGYVGALAPVFAPFLRARLHRVCRGLKTAANPARPWVVAPYPWFHRAVRGVPDERLVYYNLDDYPLYQPARTAGIQWQEDELLRRAALTVCLSRQQVETLRARVPANRAERVRHFPLGVVESYLNPHPEHVPAARTVGYVGNLIDRVDWRLVGETAQLLPDAEFIFVGGLTGFGGGGARPGWEAERAAALALPNVRRVGPVRQEDVPGHYWDFGVNWIPYATDHAFNRASCPTKIMDGLASGRPVLGTDLPELRLYPEWITVLPAAADAWVGALRARFDGMNDAASTDAERAAQQVAFARQHTWARRAETLAGWLAERGRVVL